jgi:hypothetical protein
MLVVGNSHVIAVKKFIQEPTLGVYPAKFLALSEVLGLKNCSLSHNDGAAWKRSTTCTCHLGSWNLSQLFVANPPIKVPKREDYKMVPPHP